MDVSVLFRSRLFRLGLLAGSISILATGCVRVWHLVYISLENTPEARVLKRGSLQIEDSFLLREVPIKYEIQRSKYSLLITLENEVAPTITIRVIPKSSDQNFLLIPNNPDPPFRTRNAICYGRYLNANYPSAEIGFKWSPNRKCRTSSSQPSHRLVFSVNLDSSVVAVEEIPFSLKHLGFVTVREYL